MALCRVVLILLSGGPCVGPCVASGTAPSSPKAEAGACEPQCHPKPPTTTGFDRGLFASIELESALESAASSRPRRSAVRVLRDICAALGFTLVWMTGTFFLGGVTSELFNRWYGRWYGRPLPLTAAATLAATFDACLTAGALEPLGFNRVLQCALSSAAIGCLGALALGLNPAAAAPRPQDETLQPLAPSTVWPPNLHVESISPSASVPPAFVCPITMAPMANPAITPRGTSYDWKALCHWITKHHRYPGGEARAATCVQTSVRSSGAALSPLPYVCRALERLSSIRLRPTTRCARSWRRGLQMKSARGHHLHLAAAGRGRELEQLCLARTA